MKNQLLTFCAITLISFSSFSQDDNTVTKISDNLGNTLSSKAIYKGTLLTGVRFSWSQAQVGFTNGSNGGFKSTMKALPSAYFGYGISKNVDIHVSASYLQNEWESDGIAGPSNGGFNGFGGLTIGSKVNLFKQKKWLPEIALNVDASIPNADFGFRELMKLQSTLAWGYYLGDNFRVGGNFIMRNFINSSYSETFTTDFSLTFNTRYELSNGLGFFADVMVGSFNFNSMFPTVGVYYRYKQNIQLHISAGKYYTFQSSVDSEYVSAGFSWLLFNK